MKRSATIYSLTENHSKEIESSGEIRRRRNAVSPSESVIRNLLNYSKALAVVTTPKTGFINLVMN
jgi:hypothetical protein